MNLANSRAARVFSGLALVCGTAAGAATLSLVCGYIGGGQVTIQVQ